MFAFLTINGISLTANADEAWTFVSTLYEKDAFRFETLEAWLRQNCR
jgi:death-on-curing protein